MEERTQTNEVMKPQPSTFFTLVCVCIVSVQTQTAIFPKALAATSTSTATARGLPGSPAQAPASAAQPNTSRWIWSVPGDWICRNDVDCSGGPWPGTSIRFSATVASDSNGRKSKDKGRRIVNHVDGVTPIYGYIRGQFAQECKITKVGGGNVLIEQWKYGADVWKGHWLTGDGQSYRINLVSPEDSVQIFSNDFKRFAITITDCSLASYALDVGRTWSKPPK